MSAPHPPQHVINKLLHEVVARTQPVNVDPISYTPEYQAKGTSFSSSIGTVLLLYGMLWFEMYLGSTFSSQFDWMWIFLCYISSKTKENQIKLVNP